MEQGDHVEISVVDRRVLRRASIVAIPESDLHPPDDSPSSLNLEYRIGDSPPWYLCIMFALQHFVTMFGSTFSIPMLVAPALCMGTNFVVAAELLGTIFFVSGINTVLQSSIGSRLPIVQGGSFNFLVPTFVILKLPRFQCPSSIESDNYTEIWQIRMREIQGAIIASSCFQIAIGLSGVVGTLLRYIGPLVIAPTVSLIGLSLFQEATVNASKNWWITILTIALITLFSQYLPNTKFPCCSFNRKTKQMRCRGYPIFKLFPVILAIIMTWGLCGILTVTDAIPNEPGHWAYAGRTDVKLEVLHEADWFRFPYPGQWGIPTFSAASVFGMLAGVLSGMIESIGDYYAAARMSGARPPPVHAINRGVLAEGIGCLLSGLWGAGSGTTSYTENIGAIGITKVGSRRVIQVAGVILMVSGVLGKFGALFVTMPDPIVGGVLMVMFGMITAVGISNLQFVDMNSSRNLFIFGFSMFFGLSLPQWVKTQENFINSGSDILDQILLVLLTTGMFVGGVTGFILDNTVPGTKKERGMVEWNEKEVAKTGNLGVHDDTYDLPWITARLAQWKWPAYLPVSPTYTGCGCWKESENDRKSSTSTQL
ncbi:hypothetical protein CAPTEDRAFT_122178 [Capitella teleta]|uniref:Uncharacterized protein n=1 Tax=Capitella teleta TaxID=283909 RepID=R7V571_CAPTE|nr:hypothetical protein CAPTEDRAFT_122178 [Capitella teleta]|eukprot:ELU13612.1 hypothetical protein CAPTEDRAFT_122178 [Capitella teleta]